MEKNLIFEKETIASLSNDEQKRLQAGGEDGGDNAESTHIPCGPNTIWSCPSGGSECLTACPWQMDCTSWEQRCF